MEDNKKYRIAFYLRVSTDEQAKDGFWLDMQLNGMEEMMSYRGKHHDWIHEKMWEYVDDWYSWSDLNRPAFKRMMEDAKNGKFDLIAVWKIDRLSRSLSHLLDSFETLQTYKIWFFSLKENIDFSGPIWKLTFQIFWALAEFERETIKMRTREWKNASARRGNFVINAAPFWYEKMQTIWVITKGLKIIDREAEWVKRIFAECIAWNTLNGIADLLNENKVFKGMWGIRKAKNTAWYSTAVREMLENTSYMWNAIYEPKNDKWEIEPISIPVPAIIHPLTFEIAQWALEKISENNKRWWWENSYLLSRKVFDIETKRNFVGVERTKWWHSYRRKAFELNWIKYLNREIPGKALDDFIWSHIESIIQRPRDLFEAYQKQSLDTSNYEELLKKRKKSDDKLRELENEAFTIEKQHIQWHYSDEMRDKLIKDNVEATRVEQKWMVEFDKRLDAIVQAEATKEALLQFSENLDMKIKDFSETQRRSLIDILVEKVEVTFNWDDYLVKTVLRFDPKSLKQNHEGTNQKSSPLKEKPSKESWNSEIWWECRGSNPGPWP